MPPFGSIIPFFLEKQALTAVRGVLGLELKARICPTYISVRVMSVHVLRCVGDRQLQTSQTDHLSAAFEQKCGTCSDDSAKHQHLSRK